MEDLEIGKMLLEIVNNIDHKEFLWNRVLEDKDIQEWIGSLKERKIRLRQMFEDVLEDSDEYGRKM